MIHLSTSLRHYKRPEIQKALAEHAAGKEVAARFNDRFGKRPDSLKYPRDVLQLAKNGATSFHSSEELWSNPLRLEPLMSRKSLDALRTGWDLVLDIDCKFLEYSKVAADLIVKALRHHNVSHLSVKFSGNKGFHIAVPFEAFPKEINGTGIRLLFPEAAKRVALYVKEKIASQLAARVFSMEGGSFNQIAAKTGVGVDELYLKDRKGKPLKDSDNRIIPTVEKFLAIDTLLISSRHMYRMPYSLHEKSGLVSLPLAPEGILDFDPGTATPEKAEISVKFLDREGASPGEVAQLFTSAFDATAKPAPESEQKEYEVPAEAVPEKFFPPCIQKFLLGIQDGRKRALFVLSNFLGSCGWSHEAIEARLKEWNKKNREPLHETYFLGQLRYRKQHPKKVLPPNCHNDAYYHDMGVKCPEEICSKFRNPAGYARRRSGR